MKTNIMCEEIAELNSRFEADAVNNLLDTTDLEKFVQFRTRLLEEKCGDVWEAADSQDPEDFIDSTIGVLIVAMSTLDLLGIDVNQAWNKVLHASLEDRKTVHITNLGYLSEIWKDTRKY